MTRIGRSLIWLVVLALAVPFSSRAEQPLLPAPALGDDGLYRQDWFLFSFMDLAEDEAQARADGRQLVLFVEQRGCAPCKRVHEVSLRNPDVVHHIRQNFHVIQMNLLGSREVTDFDGEVLTEKEYLRKIGVRGTPTFVFLKDAPAKGGREAVAWTTAGFLEPQNFADAFSFAAARAFAQGDDFRAWAKANPDRFRLK